MRQTSGLVRLAALAMLCVPLLSAGAQAAPVAEAAPDWEQELYTVHDYDAARDPAVDLALTLERAILGIVTSGERLGAMSDASKKFGKKDEAGDIAGIIIERYGSN